MNCTVNDSSDICFFSASGVDNRETIGACLGNCVVQSFRQACCCRFFAVSKIQSCNTVGKCHVAIDTADSIVAKSYSDRELLGLIRCQIAYNFLLYLEACCTSGVGECCCALCISSYCTRIAGLCCCEAAYCSLGYCVVNTGTDAIDSNGLTVLELDCCLAIGEGYCRYSSCCSVRSVDSRSHLDLELKLSVAVKCQRAANDFLDSQLAGLTGISDLSACINSAVSRISGISGDRIFF